MTDPFRKGVMVYLGRTGGELCPVAAVSAYLAVRGRVPGPFFVFKGGEPLSREIFVRRVRAALREILISTRVIVFKLGRLPQLRQLVWRFL